MLVAIHGSFPIAHYPRCVTFDQDSLPWSLLGRFDEPLLTWIFQSSGTERRIEPFEARSQDQKAKCRKPPCMNVPPSHPWIEIATVSAASSIQ